MLSGTNRRCGSWQQLSELSRFQFEIRSRVLEISLRRTNNARTELVVPFVRIGPVLEKTRCVVEVLNVNLKAAEQVALFDGDHAFLQKLIAVTQSGQQAGMPFLSSFSKCLISVLMFFSNSASST